MARPRCIRQSGKLSPDANVFSGAAAANLKNDDYSGPLIVWRSTEIFRQCKRRVGRRICSALNKQDIYAGIFNMLEYADMMLY